MLISVIVILGLCLSVIIVEGINSSTKIGGKKMKVRSISFRAFAVLGMLLFAASACFATPSTQIWNPSTDIQSAGTWHLGIDNYFTTAWPKDTNYTYYPTDVNLTYGALPGLEVGIDSFMPSAAQYEFNAKYGIPESGDMPAFALGAQNMGFNVDADKRNIDWSIWYSVVAKTFSFGRLTGGYYSGNDHVLTTVPDENGNTEKANTGFIATWDKAVTDKIWLCLDYASGYSAYGSFFYGGSYSFSSNTSVIFGYGTFNRHQNSGDGFDPVITTQLDINI